MRDTAKELAECIIDTARAREESYDHDAAQEAKLDRPDSPIDYNEFYKLDLRAAAEQECPAALVKPTYLLLASNWNDALEWAEANK